MRHVGLVFARKVAAMNAFKMMLSGSQPLSTAFWKYLVGGGVVALLGISLINTVIIFSFPGARVTVYVMGFFILWAYLITACVGTWRSANVARTGPLRIAAKFVVCLLLAFLALNLSLDLYKGSGVVAMMKGTWEPGSYLRDTSK